MVWNAVRVCSFFLNLFCLTITASLLYSITQLVLWKTIGRPEFLASRKLDQVQNQQDICKPEG